MAGEAPKLHPDEGPIRRWLAEGSDAGLSLLMLFVTALILIGIYVAARNMTW